MIQLERGISQARVFEFLEEYRQAYERGSESFFDCFTRDASFFVEASPTRIDSLEEFRRALEGSFGSGVARRSQFMALEMRPLGEATLVTCHNRLTVDGVVTNLRMTLCLVARDEAVRVTHLHISPLPIPVAGPARTAGFDDISVLEERVATSAALVGTPK